jgi:hypothetical protein
MRKYIRLNSFLSRITVFINYFACGQITREEYQLTEFIIRISMSVDPER